MEPVTHFLTGACIARAGLNRKTAYATVVATLAAEAADLDVLWSLAGPVEGLKHHRGITHTLWAAPVVAGVVVGAVWLWRRWRKPAAHAQAIRWGWLYGTALIAALSHLLLDWTNNYGLRPFFPFNPRWYAGSFVFIGEPVLWALLIAATVLPGLFGLADQEIGARRRPFRGRGWAIFALAGMVMLWCWRWSERAQALAVLQNQQLTSEPARRIALEPYPLNPFRWHAILETADYYQTAEMNTRTGVIETDATRDLLYKPTDTAAVEAAKRTALGQVYLDWGRWAVVRDLGQQPIPGLEPPTLLPGRRWTTVSFTDLRFGYSFLGSGNGAHHPLAGQVYIVDGREEAGMALNGRVQR
jgi:inner membrane protein